MRQKTFRLFVSSTFKDFQPERRILNELVAPKLQSYCEEYGYAFELIDLRWGVSDEASANQLTLRICINEILRCKQYSPRPHFLLMLGGRYGSIPVPSELPPEVFDAVVGVLEGEKRRLIEEWYVFDDNRVGGTYALRSREGKYREYANWSPVKNGILAALAMAIDEGPGWLTDNLSLISTTEHEFEAGLIDQDMAEGAVVFLRKGDEDDEAPARELRLRAAGLMEGKRLESHVFELCAGTDGYLARFEANITAHLRDLIDAEVRRLGSDVMAESHYSGEVFVGRGGELAWLDGYLHSSERAPLVVRGVSGSGKSTLASRFVGACDCPCVFVSYGRAEDLFTMSGAIREVCRQLRQLRGFEGAPQVNSINAAEVLWDELLLHEGENPTLVLIDGLEGLLERESVRSNVLPRTLPRGVKLIVTCTDESATELLGENFGITLHLENLSGEDALSLVDGRLRETGRRIVSSRQREALDALFAGGVTPLQASLVSSISARWKSGTSQLDLPTSSEDAALSYIEAAFSTLGHGRELTLHALALVCEAPFGISEQELLELLPKVATVREEFGAQDRYSYDGTRLPYVVWSRLYYDLRDCLETVMFKGVPVIRFEHSVFYRVMKDAYGALCMEAKVLLCDEYLSWSGRIGGSPETLRTMRASNLPVLLKSMGRHAELTELLCSAEFLDSMVRAADYDVAASLISGLLDDLDPSIERDALSRCLSQLRIHRGSLTSYTRSLPVALSGRMGLPEAEGFRLAQEALRKSESTLTPIAYSPLSQLVWSPDDSMCAIWRGSTIYVCDNGWSEVSRVIVRDEVGGPAQLADVCWLCGGAIAAATTDGAIHAYRVDVRMPTLVAIAKVSSRPLRLIVVRPERALVVIMQSDISVLDGSSLKSRFGVNIGEDGTACLSYDQDFLAVHDGKGSVILRSLVDGRILNRIRAKKVEDHSIIGVLSDGSLVFADYPLGFLVTNASGTGRRYLYPPRAKDRISAFIQRDMVVCAYENGIYAANLLTGERAAYRDIAGVRGVFPKPPSDEVTVVTDLGVQDVEFVEDASSAETPPLFQTGGAVSAGSQLSMLAKALWLWARVDIAMRTRRSWGLLGLNALSGQVSDGASLSTLLDRRVPSSVSKPTLVEQSKSGVTAVAYELSDAIVVYDRKWDRILTIDKLRFSAFDPLLHMRVSDDGSKLLVHRASMVRVYGVDTGKCLLEVSLVGDAVRDVRFRSDSEAVILVADGTERSYQLEVGEKSVGTLSGVQYGSDDLAIVTVPSWINDEKATSVDRGSSSSNVLVSVKRGFEVVCSDSMRYKGDGQSVSFVDGTFYLEGDSTRPFLSLDCDFSRCLEEERQRVTSQVELFVREKNDMTSGLHSIGDRLLLLVCYRLSSAIIFDTKAMAVREAYRHHLPIIGSKLDRDASTLTLFSNVQPFITVLGLPATT